MSRLDSEILYKLPTSLTGELLGNWLSFKDTVNLDSAHCNHHLRSSWLRLVGADECIVREPGLKAESTHWDWLNNRGVKIARVELKGSFSGGKGAATYFQKFGEIVKQIVVDDATGSISSTIMKLIATHCTQLMYFECANSSVNAHFHQILQRNPNLEVLMFVGLSDVKLEALSLSNLHTIALYRCPFVNDKSILSLAKLSDKITKLVLDSCGDMTKPTLVKFAAQLPLLQALDITNGQTFDNNALNALTKACPLITDLIIYGNHRVTDVGLKQVLVNLPRLRVLDIQACTSLTDQALVNLALHGGSTLEVLYIGDGMSFTVSAVSWMLSMFHKLRTLVWTAEIGIEHSEVDLQRAFVNLRNVKTLMLGDGMCCDAALKMVGQHCKQLQNFNFYYNAPDEDTEEEYELPHTAQGVFAVAQGCIQLRKVVCSKDNEVLNELAQMFWKVQNPLVTFSDENDLFSSNALKEPL